MYIDREIEKIMMTTKTIDFNVWELRQITTAMSNYLEKNKNDMSELELKHFSNAKQKIDEAGFELKEFEHLYPKD